MCIYASLLISVYVCVHVYVCVCVPLLSFYVSMYVYIHMYMCVSVCVCVAHLCICVCLHVWLEQDESGAKWQTSPSSREWIVFLTQNLGGYVKYQNKHRNKIEENTKLIRICM